MLDLEAYKKEKKRVASPEKWKKENARTAATVPSAEK